MAARSVSLYEDTTANVSFIPFRTVVSAVTKRLNVSAWGACCYTLLYSWVWGQHSNGQRSPPPVCIRRHLGLHRQEEPSIKDTKYLIACAKSNMCATMHVQKDLKLWSLIFKGHRDDLRQNVKKKKQSENPLNIALVFRRKSLIWWPNTFCITYSLLFFFWYHIACRDLLLQFSNQWLCHQI